MNKIITIGRQLGSGGREIGKKLADNLGIAYYDKKLLELAAKDSGLCEYIIGQYDENGMSSLLYSFAMNPLGFFQDTPNAQPLGVRAQLAVRSLIQQLANQGPAVFVGRCADVILADRDDVVNVFISANIDDRIARIMQRHQISQTEASDLINKTDKARANYYNYNTSQKWGAAANYHICLDSSFWGIDYSVEILQQLINARVDHLTSTNR